MAKILIVDDDTDIVEAIQLVLEKEGHATAPAYSRVEGMRQVEDFKPDLIVLDVMMDEPDDGIAMAQDLRRQGQDCPILMLTSVAKVTGMRFGPDNELVPVDEFQEKPIDPAVLVAKVAELLARKEG
ncbi:response regulator [bacterium]|nr:response regulator [bacterium]